MTVTLTDHPMFPTDVMTADLKVLESLAADHLLALDGSAPEMERFLFGDVPVQVFSDIFGRHGRFDPAVGRWLLHLSGYFGGRWLHGEIAVAQPDAPLVGFSLEPTVEGFDAAMAHATRAVDASHASDAAAIDFAHVSLFDTPAGSPDESPVPGLTDSFGYNAGYNLEILAAPPTGSVAAPEYAVECTGLLRCSYASPKLEVLAKLEAVADALNGGDDAYSTLASMLRPVQDAAIPRGRSVWSTGLSVQGFGQRAYDQLLDVSSSFLETVQATALTMAEAHVTADADAARVGAAAAAAMDVWLPAYMAGLVNGAGPIELPRFA